jgi:DNA-binding FrmR family transcriptional regulator
MSHTSQGRDQLVYRIRRVRGQLEAVEKQLQVPDHDPYDVLQTLTACRGGLNSLVASIIEGHVRHHVVDSKKALGPKQSEAVEQLVEIIRTYLK